MLTQAPCLRFTTISPGQPFFAARTSGRDWADCALHTHDFHEVIFVASGQGLHLVNDQEATLEAGDLLFIRPRDVHQIEPGLGLVTYSAAFPSQSWRKFVDLAGISGLAREIDDDMLPLHVSLAPEALGDCEEDFAMMVERSASNPSQLDMCDVLAAVARWTFDTVEEDEDTARPVWLEIAMDEMRDAQAISEGLPRLVEVSGVSLPHLCRTFRKHLGQSPTDWINTQRMNAARSLMLTSDLSLAQIAQATGIHSRSYMHRLFRETFGEAPEAYRRRMARTLVCP